MASGKDRKMVPKSGLMKRIFPSLSQAISDLVPLLNQEAARFEAAADADVKDKLESINAFHEYADLEAMIGGQTVAHKIQHFIDIYNSKHSDRNGFVAFLRKIDLLLRQLEPRCNTGSIASCQVLRDLVPLLNQEAARFEEAADVKDKLESINTSLKDADLKPGIESEVVAHSIQGFIDEYNSSQQRDRNGFIAFLLRIDLLVKKLKPRCNTGSIDFLNGWSKTLFRLGQLKFEVFNSELVKKAVKSLIETFLLGARKRLVGDLLGDKNRYSTNLIYTAILFAFSTNSDAVVAAGLLVRDSLYDTKQKYKALKMEFGREVAKLARDVSKLNRLSEISRKETLGNPEHMQHLILAMVEDARAVMIKVIAHTGQMLGLYTLNAEEKQGFVKETLDVYVPLSERLGFNSWKRQLENLCVSPSDEMKKLYESISEYDEDGIAFEVKLRDALKGKKLTDFRVESRKKSLLSIWNKMPKYRSSEKEKNKMSEDSILFSQIRDIIGLRIIVENVEECYKAKDAVEKLWKAKSEFEKDYIKNPKPDGYSSLHVCVKNAKDQYMEVQIRTKKMHTEFDDTHWLYKEGGLQVPEHVKSLIEFARLVNKQAIGKTTTLSNSSPHRPKCPYAKIDKPPCLDANTDCKFPGRRPVYVIVRGKNEATIEEYSSDSRLKDLRWPEGLQGQVLVNGEHQGLNYTLRAGDIIKFE